MKYNHEIGAKIYLEEEAWEIKDIRTDSQFGKRYTCEKLGPSNGRTTDLSEGAIKECPNYIPKAENFNSLYEKLSSE